VNPTLRMLSMTYCGITHEGADALFEILIYSKSVLEDINLNGNLLKDEGVIKLLYGVSIAKSLKKLAIADNQFSDTENVMKALEFCMGKNDRLGKYDLKYNNIGSEGLVKLTDILRQYNHVFDVEIPERVEGLEEKESFEAFRKQLDENKPKKGKGKKGGKKKKKK